MNNLYQDNSQEEDNKHWKVLTAWKTFLINHQELQAVENNSGDVADDEHDNDEDEDSDEVELSLDISTPLSLVRSRKIFSK